MRILPVLGMLLVITALIAALAGVSFFLLAKGLFAFLGKVSQRS